MPDYLIYGQRVRADAPIPGLRPCEPAHDSPDIVVGFGRFPDWDAALLDRLRRRGEIAGDADAPMTVWKFEVGGRRYERWMHAHMRFIIGADGRQIWAEWDGDVSPEYAAVHLLGPVIGYVAHLLGMLCLHAAAVLAPGGALGLMGDPGAGKSTTSIALAFRGYPLLSEDHLVLDRRADAFHVLPGYPAARLWPASVRMLVGAPEALPLLVPGFEKRYLDLSGTPRAHGDPEPLRALYWLTPRVDDDGAPALEPLRPPAALNALLRNSYAGRLLDKAGRAAEFGALADLAGRVRVCRVTPHADPARLGALCDLITGDFARHAGG